MERLVPTGRAFHDKRVKELQNNSSLGPKKGKVAEKPSYEQTMQQGFQAFGPNPVEFEKKRAPGYKPPKDSYKYKGPVKIGGEPLSSSNMKAQIDTLTKVRHF